MNKFASTNPEFKCVYHAKFDWNLSSGSLVLFQGMIKNHIFYQHTLTNVRNEMQTFAFIFNNK